MAQLPLQHDLFIYRGDTFRQSITLQTGGLPVDLTTAQITAQCRIDTELRSRLVFDFTIVEIDFTLGKFKLVAEATKTENLRKGIYVWDLQIVIGGEPKTWLTGELELSPDVTRAA